MLVPGIGPLNAKIVLVGEAPGAEEESSGIPFVGASGKLLNMMLSNAGIDRNSCYITNVVKQRPPGNDFAAFYEDKQRRVPTQLLQQSIKGLHDELRRIKPNIIVPLGAEALRAVSGKIRSEKGILHGPITEWRGSLFQTEFGKCCPTLHPAHVLRMYRTRFTVECDLRRVAEEACSAILNLPKHQFQVRPSFSEVIDFLKQPHKRLAFDIETSGPFVRCLGFADRSDHAICIPFMSSTHGQFTSPQPGLISIAAPPVQQNSAWSPAQEYDILTHLHRLFSDPSIEKIAQNFPFDSLVLARDFGFNCIPGFSLDTMVAQHTCYSELPKGLDYLASIYTRVPYYSDFDPSDDRATFTYNCYDCAVTFEIADKLLQEMADHGVLDFYRSKVHPAIVAYTRCETRGLLVDQAHLGKERIRVTADVERLTNRLKELTNGKLVNPNSPDQVSEFLYKTLNLKPIYHHKTRQITTDKHAREKLRLREPHLKELFDTLDDHKSKSTLLNSFINRPIDSTGRIRTHYNVAGTVTGRLSSGEDKEQGPVISRGAFGDVVNLQNLPRGAFRKIILADPGRTLLKADLSQAEWLIVAWKANIRYVIEKYTSDPSWKVHRWVASKVFNKPEDQITKKLPEGQIGLSEYDLAKNGVYGSIYGMHDNTAAITWKVAIHTARFMLQSIHGLFPEIKYNYWQWIREQLLTTRMIVNPLGRKRTYFDRFSDDMERDARSDYAQSTIATLINMAFVKCDEFPEEEAFPAIQAHDEIVLSVQQGMEVKYAKLLRDAMTVALNFPGTPEPLIIPVEIGAGKSWGECNQML